MAAHQTTLCIKTVVLLCGLLLALQLSGCATATSGLECGVESLNPTVMGAVDSFESAALAIKLSNQVLLEMPISEQDSWPDKLYGAPSGSGMLKMGLSLLGASQGVAVPFEIDPTTGLPRPTSALYLFLKEREQMLNKEASREDLLFFRTQSPRVIAREIPFHRRQPTTALIDEHVYRNPLMAFGVVTANREEMVRVQQDLDLLAQGFKQCDAWVHASREGDIKPAACRDPALTSAALGARIKKASYAPDDTASAATPEQPTEDAQPLLKPSRDLRDALNDSKSNRSGRKTSSSTLKNKKAASAPTRATTNNRGTKQTTAANKRKQSQPPQETSRGIIYVSEQDRQLSEKGEELATMRQNYGRLASRVYDAAVAGADFSVAALVKIGCAIVNGARALPNIEEEFKGARGVYNLVLVTSRIKMIISAFGYYKNNLGLQYTAYTAMYQQIKGTYPELKDDDPSAQTKTAQALQRIQLATAELQLLEPKLQLLAQGQLNQFSDDDLARLQRLAALYPDQHELRDDLLLAWSHVYAE
jgi:hypothetical protein